MDRPATGTRTSHPHRQHVRPGRPAGLRDLAARQRHTRRGDNRPAIVLSAVLKTAFQPLVAWGIGAGVFHLHGAALLDVVVTSALPAAQNLYTYASQYRVAEQLARESILLSTLGSIPALITVAALLG